MRLSWLSPWRSTRAWLAREREEILAAAALDEQEQAAAARARILDQAAAMPRGDRR